ncbi:MAG: nucleotidyltransferase family protein [Saprospiraceae bacterium]|nr:nucleotidyltransferase family protein [Saprospiraceae bacterium]
MKTGIIILAAGASRRMGQPKQLLEWRGESLLARICRISLSANVTQVVVVLGAHAPRIRPELDAFPEIQIAINEQWDLGMSSSIQAGLQLQLSQNPNLDAVLILLVDQPYIQLPHIQQFLAAATSEAPLVAADYGKHLGVPCLFKSSLFDHLLQLDGAAGARHLIRTHQHQATTISLPQARLDLDTPEDWKNFLEQQE